MADSGLYETGPAESSSPGASDIVLAVDPGRAKCGIAVVKRDKSVMFRTIVSTDDLLDELIRIVGCYKPDIIVIGNGTGSSDSAKRIRAAAPMIPIVINDESFTSEMARARFVAENRPRGWQRLLPASLRTPDSAYDDYVAVILAERFHDSQTPES